jgi:hypothetical protein
MESAIHEAHVDQVAERDAILIAKGLELHPDQGQERKNKKTGSNFPAIGKSGCKVCVLGKGEKS